MIATDLLRSAVRNTFRMPLRAALTIVAIMIGAFTFTITSGLGAGVSDYIGSQTRAVGASSTVQVTQTRTMSFLNEGMEAYEDEMTSAGADFGTGIISQDDVAQIESLLEPGDEYVASRQVTPLFYAHGESERYRFIYNGYWPGKTSNLVAGDQLSDDTEQAQLIIPAYATEALGFDSAEDAVGETVTVGVLGQDGEVRDLVAEVVGIQERSLIGGNLPFGNKVFDTQLQELSWVGSSPDDAEWYATVLVSGDDVRRLSADLQEAGFATATAEQTVGDFQSIVSGVLLILNLLAGVAIAAAMFGIVNTLLMSIQERTRQIGMLRALGMSRSRVFSSVALEAGLLSLIGGVSAASMGVVAGTFLGPVALRAAGLDLPGLVLFEFSATSIALIVVAVIAAALLAALPPALRAARLDPMDALREER